jgi:hypothetical protein
MMLVLAGSYLAMLGLFITFFLASGQSVQAVLDTALITTLFYLLAAILITIVRKPAYSPRVKVKPIHVSMTVTALGALLLIILFVVRQPDDESRLRFMVNSAIFVLIVGALSLGFSHWQSDNLDKHTGNTLALVIAVIGTVVAALAGPVLLRLNEPTMQLRVSLLIMMYGFVLFFALAVLHQITKPNVNPTTIPDGYAGVVKAKGRIERISFDKSMDVKLKGEVFEKQDLRLQTDTVKVNNCMTADHVPTDIQALVEWQLIKSEDGLLKFFTHSSDPEKAMKSLLRAAIVCEIGQRGSLYVCGREEQIATNVLRRVRATALDYGMHVMKVGVTHAMLKHPAPGQSISPLSEASRLQQMDDAIRGVSMKTVQHAEHLTDAQASASTNANHKEG